MASRSRANHSQSIIKISAKYEFIIFSIQHRSLALLHLEFRTLDVDAVLADAFGRSGLNPRQILEAGEGLVLTKVDDEVVGELDTAVGGPISGFLQVEYLVGSLVAALDILIVTVSYLPGFAAEACAVGTKHIPLGDAAVLAVVVAVEGFDADVATADGLRELHFLPTVAGLELTFEDGLLAREVEGLTFEAVRLRAVEVELVDDRLLQAFDGLLAARAHDVEDDDLILSLLQPAARHIQRLLRTNIPVTADSMAIDIDLTLAPVLEVEEGVAHLLQVEVATVVANALGHELLAFRVFGLQEGAHGRSIVVLDTQVIPLAGCPGGLYVIDLGGDDHVGNESLEVLDGAAEVDAAHSFHENHQIVVALHGRQDERRLVFHAVDLTDELAVDEYLCVVVGFELHDALHGNIRQLGNVHHGAPAKVHLLEGHPTGPLHNAVGTPDERLKLVESELGNSYRRVFLRHGGKFLAADPFLSHGIPLTAVFLHGLAKLPELIGHLTGLVDGRVVVVGSHVGREARAVGACPMAPTGASVGHVKREADAALQHLRDAIDHGLCTARLVATTPLVEPSAPELRAHLRAVGTQLAN